MNMNMNHFMPHGHCVMWDPVLLSLHVGSDFIIFLSYCSIPLAIYYYNKKRPLNAGIVPYLFIAFILSCAFTHIYTIWNWWNADYWQSGTLKLVCAIISATTATALWFLMPKFLSLPTPKEYSGAVTERDRLELENIKIGNENRSKSDVLASVTHEIRNHLNVMLGSSELIARGALGRSELFEANGMMYNNTRVLDRLINDILDLSKIETHTFNIINEPFSFPVFIEDLRSEYHRKGTVKDIDFIVDDTSVGFIDMITADRVRISQVLRNLISNAFKYSKSGEIRVEIQKIRHSEDSKSLKFLVKDQGEGIPLSDQEAIFETFTRSKVHDSIEGVGIGLSVSKKIAEIMGGKLSLVKSDENGSTFKFVVPIEEVKKKKVNKETPSTLETPSWDGRKILVADDSLENIRIVQMYLKGTNAIIDYANDGKEALEKLLNVDYDVAVLDIEMPYYNGIQIAKKINEENINIYLIALSARVNQETIAELNNSGFKGYVPKPYKHSELVDAINKGLRIKDS